jgi:hypothetical protein
MLLVPMDGEEIPAWWGKLGRRGPSAGVIVKAELGLVLGKTGGVIESPNCKAAPRRAKMNTPSKVVPQLLVVEHVTFRPGFRPGF